MTRLHLVSPDLPQPPWARWHGAPEEAWWAFAAYRDLGPMRTVERLHQRTADLAEEDEEVPTLAQLETWCEEWRWEERAAAYDAHRAGLRPVRKLTAEYARQQIAGRSEELLERLFTIALDKKSRALRVQVEVIFKLLDWMGLAEDTEDGAAGDGENVVRLRDAIKDLSDDELKALLKKSARAEGK